MYKVCSFIFLPFLLLCFILILFHYLVLYSLVELVLIFLSSMTVHISSDKDNFVITTELLAPHVLDLQVFLERTKCILQTLPLISTENLSAQC